MKDVVWFLWYDDGVFGPYTGCWISTDAKALSKFRDKHLKELNDERPIKVLKEYFGEPGIISPDWEKIEKMVAEFDRKNPNEAS